MTASGSGVPVWLLDVDGVLNVPRPGWHEAPRSGRAHLPVGEYRLRWAKSVVDRVRQLGTSGAVEIRWATTWVDWIGEIERLMSFPSWQVAFSRLGESPSVKARNSRSRLLSTSWNVNSVL